jgi:hypothetical protein
LLSHQQQAQQRQKDSEQLISRMAEQLEHSQKSIEALTGILGGTRPIPSGQPIDVAAVNSDSDSMPAPAQLSWEMQKQMLMSGLAEDTKTSPPPQTSTVPKTKASSFLKSGGPPACDEQDDGAKESDDSALQPACAKDTTALGHCDQSQEIRRLRSKLEDKLRDAEIEISIERARIHRARRDLEQQRVEFEREVMRMQNEKSSGKSNSKNNKKKDSNRWARFLGNNQP